MSVMNNLLMNRKLVVMLIACVECLRGANRSWSQSWFKCKCEEPLLMLRAASWQVRAFVRARTSSYVQAVPVSLFHPTENYGVGLISQFTVAMNYCCASLTKN